MLKTIVLILSLMGSPDSEKEVHLPKRKVEFYLYLPNPKYENPERYEIKQSYAMKRFLDKHMDDLQSICDFRIVDISQPGNKYLDEKLIPSHTFRIANGDLISFSDKKFENSLDFYRWLRYYINLDRVIIGVKSSRELWKTNRFRTEIRGEEYRINGYQTYNKLSMSTTYTFPIPELQFPGTLSDHEYYIQVESRYKRKRMFFSYTNYPDDMNEIYRQLDYGTGLLKELYEEQKKEK